MKRCNQKIITNSARVLRYMRSSRGLSMRKAAQLLGTSGATINHIDNGRKDISKEWTSKLVIAYGYTMEDYQAYLSGQRNIPFDQLKECQNLLEKLPKEKLKVVLSLLQNL